MVFFDDVKAGKQFNNLADVQETLPGKLNRLKILLLADDRHAANVVIDHIQAFKIHSRHEIVTINPIHETCPEKVWFNQFDVILIHYSIFVLSEYFLPSSWRHAVILFNGLKAQIIQDEHRNINAMKGRMAELQIRAVFSSLNSEVSRKVYGGELLSQTSFYGCLPGYVANNFFDFSPPPIAKRPLHVVYRGRILPAFLGRVAQEKRIIGEQLNSVADRYNLKVDITSLEERRIYGRQWPQFLMSGRATLGVEGGASIFDYDGSITKSVSDYQESNPDAEFEQIWAEVLQPHEGNVIHKTLTPKLLEAIAAKTALILYPGKYNGLLEPHRHYIPMRRDGSNMEQVVRAVHDVDHIQSLVDRTYSEVLLREDITMRFYISRIDYILSSKMKFWHNHRLRFMINGIQNINERLRYFKK